jgi:5-methylcytosine-specific restriction endonuclease McrA
VNKKEYMRAYNRSRVVSGENARACRTWRAANVEKARALDRVRYASPERREAAKATKRRWGKANRVKRLLEVRRRQAIKQGATCNCCAPISFRFIYLQARSLKMHVDHVRPLAKGGKHCLRNLQLLEPVDNLRKGASYVEA